MDSASRETGRYSRYDLQVSTKVINLALELVLDVFVTFAQSRAPMHIVPIQSLDLHRSLFRSKEP